MSYLQVKAQKHIHRYFIDADDPGVAVCLCGQVQGKRGGNKFKAKKSSYKNYTYDSQKEANYAAELDLLKKAGKIKGWDRQFPVDVYPEGKHLFTTKVDFRVHALDGSYELHEVKGWITEKQPDYKLKRKCIELYWLPKHPEYQYIVIN